jgi:hypothetical protein
MEYHCDVLDPHPTLQELARSAHPFGCIQSRGCSPKFDWKNRSRVAVETQQFDASVETHHFAWAAPADHLLGSRGKLFTFLSSLAIFVGVIDDPNGITRPKPNAYRNFGASSCDNLETRAGSKSLGSW